MGCTMVYCRWKKKQLLKYVIGASFRIKADGTREFWIIE